jgi:hypothetical protein
MPIIGITASSNQAIKLTNFYSIATTTLSTTAASITFSSIPQGYKHLQIRGLARCSTASVDANIDFRFNSDSGTNYSNHGIYGSGSGGSLSPFGNANEAALLAGRCTAANSTSNYFGGFVMDILDYTDTNKYKTIKSLTSNNQNSASGYLFYFSGNWRSTNAVNSISLYSFGANLVAGTTMALYGVL